jgi:flagellar assembly factor FliW
MNANGSVEIKQKFTVECQLGLIEYQSGDIIHFPEGLYGYEEEHRYILFQHPKYLPFCWLISLDQPNLIFPVTDPQIVMANYHPDIKLPGDSQMLVVVTIGESLEKVTANLRAPIIFSLDKHEARQIILDETQYLLRHPIIS